MPWNAPRWLGSGIRNSDVSEASPVDSRVVRLFEETLRLELPSADTDLFETGVLDSMAFVELLHELEQQFGITVPIEDLELDNFRTIKKIEEFVANRERLPESAQRGP